MAVEIGAAGATTRRRVLVYACVSLVALVLWALLRGSREWAGPVDLHIALDTASTVLAMVCGVMALMRYATRRDAAFLLMGAGLLGAAVLELSHVLTSTSLVRNLPTASDVLSPWSFMIARSFLAGLLLSAVLAWRWRIPVEDALVRPRTIAALTVLFTGAALFLLTSLHLPPAYRPALVFSRPFELIPGMLLLAALVGAVSNGRWRRDPFDHWLLLGLIVMAAGQLLFMAQSFHLHGPLFFAGHTAKILGFGAILVGLLSDVLAVFRQVETASAETLQRNSELLERNNALATLSATLQELQRISVSEYATYQDLYREYLDVGCAMLGLRSGIISGVVGERYCVRAIRSYDALTSGDEIPLEQTYCSAAIARRRAVTVTSRQEAVALGITAFNPDAQSYIGAPIYVRRAVHGTVCFFSDQHRPQGFAAHELDLVTAMAQTLGLLIEREEADARQAEVDRMKDEFLSVVSHELRTPLTAIRGSLGLLSGGILGDLPPAGQRMMHIASVETERLVRLINDLLDIEKMNAGRVVLEREWLDPDDVISTVVSMLQPLAGESDVLLIADGACDGRVWADADRLQQALTNLVSNAIKFSPEGGAVVVRCTAIFGGIEFSVTDQGRGIPPEKLDTVFERFAQVDSSDAREKGGTGLGLPICKEIVELHGGTIHIESRPGAGSTFVFVIPTDGAPAPVQVAVPDQVQAS